MVSEERRREVVVEGRPEESPFEVEASWISGWDFTVVFDDALVGGLNQELDELRENLAVSEGVTAVLHEDREVFHLKVEDLGVSQVEERIGEALRRTGLRYDR
jgi:hypothetical protein